MGSSTPGYGANAYGLGYYEMGFDDPDGPYYTTAPVYISAGPETSEGIPTGGGDLQGEGDGADGVGFVGGSLYSFANLSTGVLYANADWNTQNEPITDLEPGADYAEGAFYDTVTFHNVPAGATATFMLASSSFEVDTNGGVTEELYGDGYEALQTATANSSGTTITLQTPAGTTPEAGWTSVISITFPIVSGVAYSIGAEAVAQTYEPPADDQPGPGIVDGIAEIDPAWSVILPAGVTETTASGVAIPLACFAAGTRVQTLRGAIAVEALTQGDRVVTVGPRGSATRRIVWLGHRHVDCRAREAWPVRVRAGAFGPGRPGRDLLLSPDHAVFVDGVLLPVRHLVNRATIAQERAAHLVYWHVELDRHAAILAEDLACESYLDTGNRAGFARGAAAA